MVPANVLSQLLDGLQAVVLLLGAQQEQVAIGERFKPKAELRRHFQLVVGTPSPGSYAVPLEIRDMRVQPSFDDQDSNLLDKTYRVFSAVSANAVGTLRTILPDSAIRSRVLRELSKFVPKAGDEWSFEWATRDSPTPLTLTSASARVINEWLVQPAEHAVMSVIGELIRIDFEARKVEIRHPVTNREISCYYNPEIEDTLVEGRHDPIQVTGEFTLDEDNYPKLLTNVTRIEPVDLSPFVVEPISIQAGRYLVPKSRIEVTPELDVTTTQLFVAVLDKLEVSSFGETREQMIDSLSHDLAFLWEEYVEEDENLLDEYALELRLKLLGYFENREASGRS